MDEQAIIAAILQSRAAYDRLAGRLDPNDFSEHGKLVVKCARNYYTRDTSAKAVDRSVISSEIRRTFPNPKHADSCIDFLEDIPSKVSIENVTTEYRLLRRSNVALELAGLLGTGATGQQVDKLIQKYQELGVEQEGEKAKLDRTELHQTVGDGNRIRVLPGRLNRAFAGGALPGHHIVVFGRPESGKSMFAINMAAGFLRQGLHVLYAGNEEPLSDLQKRFLSRLSKVTLSDIQKYPKALDYALDHAPGYELLICKELTTGKTAELEAHIRRYEPDVVVVDQLRNLNAPGAGNRSNELDDICREVRRLGKQYETLMISVTQAGGEAEGKLGLGMNDIDNSKTGIPGACDALIGIGTNKKWDREAKRLITCSKNKIGGKHDQFTAFVEYEHNKYMSKRKRRSYS